MERLLTRWAAVLAVDVVLAIVWLISLAAPIRPLLLVAAMLTIGIGLLAGILLPVVLRTGLMRVPHRRLLSAGLGAATGLVMGLVPFFLLTGGIAVLIRLERTFVEPPSQPWAWPAVELPLAGLAGGVTGLIVLRGLPAAVAPEMREPSRPISPDGRWRWDGSRWLPRQEQHRAVYSEDGRWYWEGTRWVPTETPPGS